ncbi:MAG: GLPGLI family protein [Bacteroidales bacterium]|jgi:GLPGLI family protein|nr:GLPGLI family protein [Bacteroidales bacterium]
MNKHLVIISVVFFNTVFCFGQQNGIVNYTITHNWIKKILSCEYFSKTDRERYAYVWSGDNEWEVKAEVKFNVSEYRYDELADEEDSRWRKGDDYIIYRDLDKGETFDIMTVLNKEYVVQDSIYCQNWKIKNDMREIAGRICMNASFYDTLKGKEIVAWFALDLPISIGPDKYCGLPGMILEVNEANGAKVYTATSIIFSDEKVVIEKPVAKKKRKVIQEQEYNQIVSKYINECKKMQRPYFWGGLSF